MSEENMVSNYPHPCPCCGEGTIESLHDICLVCGWEDDEVQNDDVNFRGGANKLSLTEHRQEFARKREANPNYKWVENCK